MSLINSLCNHPFSGAQRVLGFLLTGFSATLLVPAGIGLLYGDGGVTSFLLAFAITLVAGLLVWAPVRGQQRELRVRDGALVVVLFWVVLSLFGAIPLYLTDQPWMTYTEAVFETVSGLTTTGASVMSNLQELPHSVLWYRSQLHWLGGMGIIVLAVAILPLLGVGGVQLFRAETPGPMKDDKITPRIKESAKGLWGVYVGITGLCALSYALAGMNVFDAVTQSFSTLATGGFANYDASLGHYHSHLILMLSTFFMWLAGMNFTLHFMALRYKNPIHHLRNPEMRAYTVIMLVASLVVVVALYVTQTYTDWADAVVQGTFLTVSIMTTTGFVSAPFAHWPFFIPVVLMLVACIGGCAGSTAGGSKVARFVLLFKQSHRSVLRMIHPNAELPVKVGGNPISAHVMQGIGAFFFLYVISFLLLVLILMAFGLSGLTAFSAVDACINNMGPGLGEVASNYSSLGTAPLWTLIFAMLWGRLEIFTVLMVLMPAFWKR